MNRNEFVQRIAGDADSHAEDAFASGEWRKTAGGELVPLVSDAAKALFRNSLLSKRTQAQRLEVLLRGLKVPRDQLGLLALAGRSLPPHLRVTVANALPARVRRFVYGSGPASAESDAQGGVEPPAASARKEQQDGSEYPDVENGEGMAYATVLLISHPDHQDPNRRLLESAGLDPVVVSGPEETENVLLGSADVCGCSIDRSALVLLDAEEQRALFRSLAGYSSFIAVRVHDDGALLVPRDDVKQIIKEVRRLSTAVPHDSISFQPDGAIRGGELSFYTNAAELLQAHKSAAFVLGDLSSAEAHLLVATARARARAEGLGPEPDSAALRVRFLSGGRSGARLFAVTWGKARALVAKVTSKAMALDEIWRFRTLVQPWNDELRPECHFHGSAAVILFGLVRRDDDPSIPAEPLASRLEELWNKQWLLSGDADLDTDEMFLARGLVRTAELLAELNTNSPPPDIDVTSYVNPPATHLENIDRDGFAWGLGASSLIAFQKAAERSRGMREKAVVHGDIHLRNILIRGESQIHFIDYAATGPGHPAVDLVRFELALYLGPVRQFEDQRAGVAFQRMLSIERVSLEVLRARCANFFQCCVNGACAAGMTAARDAAIRVVQGHGGDPRDYLAAKFLLAWQYMGLIGMHTALARAVIVALTDEIAAW